MLIRSRENVSEQRLHLRRWVSGQIRRFILDTCQDDLQLLEVVGGGAFKFRVMFIKVFPKDAVDETIANHVFAFLCAQVAERFGDRPVGEVLDALEVNVVRPPSQEEVDAGWTIHSESTEEAKRFFNLPTGEDRGADDDLNPTED